MSNNSKLFSGFDSESFDTISTNDITLACDATLKHLFLKHAIATLQSKDSNTITSKPQKSPENNCLNQDFALNFSDIDLLPGSPLENLHVKPTSSSKPKLNENMDFFCMENFKNENHSTEESSDSTEGRTSERPLHPSSHITYISDDSSMKSEKSYNFEEFLSQTENHSTEGSLQMTPPRSEQAIEAVSVNMSPSYEPISEEFADNVFDELNTGVKENSILFKEDAMKEDVPFPQGHYQNNYEGSPIIYQEEMISFAETNPSPYSSMEDGVVTYPYSFEENWDIMARFSPNTACFTQGSLNNNYVNLEENCETDSIYVKVPDVQEVNVTPTKKTAKRKGKKEEKMKEGSYDDKSKVFNPKNKVAFLLIFFRNGFLTHEKMEPYQMIAFKSFLKACYELGVSPYFLQSQGFIDYLTKFYENAFKGAKKGTRDYTAKRITLDLAQDKTYGLQICTLLKYFVSEEKEAFIEVFDSFLGSSRMESHNKRQIREYKGKILRQIEEIEDALKSTRPIEELKNCTNISVFLKGDKKNAGKGKGKRVIEDLGEVDSECEFMGTSGQKKTKYAF